MEFRVYLGDAKNLNSETPYCSIDWLIMPVSKQEVLNRKEGNEEIAYLMIEYSKKGRK